MRNCHSSGSTDDFSRPRSSRESSGCESCGMPPLSDGGARTLNCAAAPAAAAAARRANLLYPNMWRCWQAAGAPAQLKADPCVPDVLAIADALGTKCLSTRSANHRRARQGTRATLCFGRFRPQPKRSPETINFFNFLMRKPNGMTS